jgi:hypothetical protein
MAREYVEAEHPRWPKDSPNGKGGEWRPKSGGWAGQVAAQLGFSPRDELLHVLKNGLKVDQSTLVGGESSETSIVDFEMPDGSIRRLVRKRHGSRGEAHTEANASILAEAIGAPIEPVVIDAANGQVTWTPLVQGRSAMELLMTAYHGGSATWSEIYSENEELYFEALKSKSYIHGLARLILVQQDTDQGRLLGLFDMLAMNHDRHEGNWLVLADGSPVGIDHVGLDTSTEVEQERVYWTDSPFARHFMFGDEVPDEGYGAVAYNGLADNDMHPDDLSLIARRIAALYDEGGAFADGVSAGSPFEEEAIMSRMRLIAAHARGTRRRVS